MRNCMCHDKPVCKTGYGLRKLDENGVVIGSVLTGLTRRVAVKQYWLSTAHTVQLLGHRRVIAERSWK